MGVVNAKKSDVHYHMEGPSTIHSALHTTYAPAKPTHTLIFFRSNFTRASSKTRNTFLATPSTPQSLLTLNTFPTPSYISKTSHVVVRNVSILLLIVSSLSSALPLFVSRCTKTSSSHSKTKINLMGAI